MRYDRRVFVVLAVSGLLLAPAAVLRAMCAGHSCDEPVKGRAAVPFCSLPDAQRDAITAGFYEGRSPDLLTVTTGQQVVGDTAGSSHSLWPGSTEDLRVPLIFWGGTSTRRTLPEGISLDAVAPTLAEHMGLVRPHPEVRSGRAVAGVLGETPPRLVILIALKGVGRAEFDEHEWPRLREFAEEGVVGEATTGSLPLDPTAVLTTIGTGGMPWQHGITGTLLRNQDGKLARAWAPRASGSVIATLADDMDELHRQRPKIGLIETAVSDRGLIGGGWYIDVDRDVIRTARAPSEAVESFEHVLRRGFGSDATTDLLGVVLEGHAGKVDRAVDAIVRLGDHATDGRSTVVIAGTGTSTSGSGRVLTATEVVTEVDKGTPGTESLIEGATAGGFFVNQRGLARSDAREDDVTSAIRQVRRGDKDVFDDVFADITVAFARFC